MVLSENVNLILKPEIYTEYSACGWILVIFEEMIGLVFYVGTKLPAYSFYQSWLPLTTPTCFSTGAVAINRIFFGKYSNFEPVSQSFVPNYKYLR